MAIVHTAAQSSGGASLTTGAIDTTGMTLLVVGTANYNNPQNDATTPVTDNKGNTYTKIGGLASAVPLYGYLYYCASPTVGTGHTFTYSLSSSAFPALGVLGTDGTGASPLDQGSNSSFATAAGTVVDSPSISTTQASEILVAITFDDDGANTCAITNIGSSSATWTKDEDLDGGSGQSFRVAHAIVSATGSYAVRCTYSPSTTGLAAGAASFKFTSGTTSTRTATPVTGALQSTLTRTATPVTVALSTTGQHGIPISDTTVGLWTTQAGGTTNLYQMIDETTADDADYVQSPVAPNTLTTYAALERQTYGQLEQRDYAALESVTDWYVAKLTSLSTPVSGARTLRYRYSKDAGTERIDLQVDLYEGATLVQSWTHTDIPTTWTQANQTVTGTVTDYTNLYVRLTATQV